MNPTLDISDRKQTISLCQVAEDSGIELSYHGRRARGLCPFHDEKTPSFYIFEDKRFHCFGGCGAHGDAIDFVQRLYGYSFKDALRHLGIEAGRIRLTPAERSKIDKRWRQREAKARRQGWRKEKIDELSLLVRCSRLVLSGIKTPDDLEKAGDIYQWLATWQYQLDVLLYGWDWERWEFYRSDLNRSAGHGRPQEEV